MKNEEHTSAIAEINKKKLRLQATLRNIEDSLSDNIIEAVDVETDRSTLTLLRSAIVRVIKGALTAADNEALFHKVHMLKLPGQPKEREAEIKEILAPKDVVELSAQDMKPSSEFDLEVVEDTTHLRNQK
jgi:hypothetical protein